MTTIRHDGYTIRSLSFRLSIMLLGIKEYIESEDYNALYSYLYNSYFYEFTHELKPALLNLAVNFRAMDDEIKRDTFTLEVLQQHYEHQTFAFSVFDEKELGLREVANKIIHTRTSYWNEAQMPQVEKIKSFLGIENEYELMVLEGEMYNKPWVVGVNLIVLAEQFYNYSEIACENCGV